MEFDYDSPAELFIPKRKGIGGARSPMTYRRLRASWVGGEVPRAIYTIWSAIVTVLTVAS